MRLPEVSGRAQESALFTSVPAGAGAGGLRVPVGEHSWAAQQGRTVNHGICPDLMFAVGSYGENDVNRGVSQAFTCIRLTWRA